MNMGHRPAGHDLAGSRHMTSPARVSAHPGIVEALNGELRRLLGPTTSVSATMNAIVPFPTAIGSLADASMLDFSVDVNAAADNDVGQSSVAAQARYTTSAVMPAACAFYEAEFTSVDASSTLAVEAGEHGRAIIEAQLGDERSTRYRVTVDDYGRYRSVKALVSYGEFDAHDLLGRFAVWHDGLAPVECAQLVGLEVSTFASVLNQRTIVLYTSRYLCDGYSSMQARQVIDERVAASGWMYVEPRDGIMFIKGGPFEAEVHLHAGDGDGARIDFVGEFPLQA